MNCPSWCVNTECDLEHWAEPGGTQWPAVAARPEAWGTAVAHPSWCEMDGLSPAVALWVDSGRGDFTLEFTPDDAETLANRLRAAAQATRRSSAAPTS